ncbi:MAG: lysophospholipid acyltransferase family protein [Novosphingobium sp.]
MAADGPGAGPAAISLTGWLRIGFRAAALIGWLALCLAGYHMWRLVRRANPWPRVFLGGAARIAGAAVRVEGQPPAGGAFLVVNHVSWLDVPALAGASGAAFVAHDGLAAIPLLKWLCEMNGTVFVARHDRASVAAQVGQIRGALTASAVLAVFPEGTTSDGTGLLAFKSSLLSALVPVPDGVVIQPVLLDYGREAAEIAWVGDELGLDNVKRILARARPVRLTIRFLPPLAGEAVADRKAMAVAARDAMLAALPMR